VRHNEEMPVPKMLQSCILEDVAKLEDGGCSLILRSLKAYLHSGKDLPSILHGHAVHMRRSYEDISHLLSCLL
jgi:hypothetical protein